MPTPPKRTNTTKNRNTRKRPVTAAVESQQANGSYGAGWGSPLEDVRMPSGTMAQLRRPGVTGLVAAGVIDNVDSLSNLISEQHIKRARGQAKPARPTTVDSKRIMNDPKALADIVMVMEKIMCYTVVQPTVIRPIRTVNGEEQKIPISERDELPLNTIWSDWVPEEDLAFIVNYAVGGTRDLAQFRDEFGESLGDLAAGKELQL